MTTTQAEAIADLNAYCTDLAGRARKASRAMATIPGRVRAEALCNVARALRANGDAIVEANGKDLAAAKDMGLTEAMLERLALTPERVEKMAVSVDEIAQQVDPIGQVIEGKVLPNGIKLSKVRVPIGVVLFIYESRPNVTSDAAALCVKSGNAVILRGGKEAIHSNTLNTQLIREALRDAGVPEDAVQLVATTDRAAVGELLAMEGKLDLCIPRGGEGLIRAVTSQARIPVIKHYTGNCHVYVDAKCDRQMALEICINAKVQRPSVCNAAETLLFDKSHVESGLLKEVCEALAAQKVEIRGDDATRRQFAAATPATADDWKTEYNDMIVAVGVVDGVDAAIDHINTHGSQHTDAIVTSDIDAADRFVAGVDAADVFVNCSTRFSDGGEYGLGAEIGISTDKLHARGPMGAADMTTYKWVAYGSGQVRS